MRRRIGFTLIELLVVIALIVALLAILMPSMSRAIYAAQLAQCTSNTRQQYVPLLAYAQDNFGLFPNQDQSPWPFYVRRVKPSPYTPSPVKTWEVMKDSYMPVPEVLGCPILMRDNPKGLFSSVYYASPGTASYGNWAGGDLNQIAIMYGWNFGFKSLAQYNSAAPLTGTRVASAGASNLMISHSTIKVLNNYVGGPAGTIWYDYGHNATVTSNDPDFRVRATDTPAMYGDGHAEVHYNDQIMPRNKIRADNRDMILYY